MNDADTTADIDDWPSDHDRIARIAYAHWEQRGRPYGSPEVDWYRAEAALRQARYLDEQLTASMSFGHQTTPRR